MLGRWNAYLFETHSESTLREWAQRLKRFRFCRAVGGHANDWDQLRLHYRYQSQSELLQFFSSLNIALESFSQLPPQPIAGKAYAGDEMLSFPSLIPGTQWIKQPGKQQIADQDLFIWCTHDSVQLSLDSDYGVGESDVEAASRIEALLKHSALSAIDPPFDSQHCISPKHYPDFFR